MWNTSEEPPGTMEEGSSQSVVHAKEKCEQNKSQLESLKEIMLKNSQSLKKKEEEVQEYARRLSKIKSRSKLSHRNKEGNMPCKDTIRTSDVASADTSKESIDDISQAKTAKAKSTLLQKKLAENRKVFEQRNKEITETKRAVEEKVEAIRQQLEEKSSTTIGFQNDQLPVTPIKPVMISLDVMSPIQVDNIQEKENKIIALNNRILELEASIVDLQENLKEKDSVIESKTRAVTLMSADLSRKGKTTLDTLEDTKDEMRTMQEHFVLLETSLKNKNESLLMQLKERDGKITQLEDTINRFKQQLNEQKLSESASANFHRSTADTLAETKEVMKSMQENFVLVESSLKAKNDNLLQQLKDNELRLAEANERIFKLESGVGIEKSPTIDDLQYKLDKLERNNKQLEDEKYELHKNIAELQNKILNLSVNGNGAIIEKDNRISELENLIDELKQSNKLLEEESKAQLQQKLVDLTLKNEEYLNKIADLEGLVHQLEEQKSDIADRLSDENTLKESDKVAKLTKELEELNKSMIKIKAQHRNKIKNLQKQLENFKRVSDTNAELVKLGNQVALLEEEKGNLQLSLVDFDELKASSEDWQECVADLESKLSAQTKEIEMQIEAIATLENQKLDLMQELHSAKQEISALEAENAESENLRVTAEMKVVDLEEQLEALHRTDNEKKSGTSPDVNHAELISQVEALSRENNELYTRISRLEEKGTLETESTESFEAMQELDRSNLLKRIEDLTLTNNELTAKLSKYEEKESSRAESAEWLETISEIDRNELLRKIEQLTQENAELTMKLSRTDEKGSSDTGSTESFERIPEHTESITKLEQLTQERNELVIKLTKLEEQLECMETDRDLKDKIEVLLQENNNQSLELSELRARLTDLLETKDNLQKQIEALTAANSNLSASHVTCPLELETVDSSKRSRREADAKVHVEILTEKRKLLEEEVKKLRDQPETLQIDQLNRRTEELLEEVERVLSKLLELEAHNQKLQADLTQVIRAKEELQGKINETSQDERANERSEMIDRLEKLNREKESIAEEKENLRKQINALLQRSSEETSDALQSDESLIVARLEQEIESYKRLIAEQTGTMDEMKIKLADKEEELEKKEKQIVEYQASGKTIESLENELKEMFNTVEEWRYKCSEMQEKVEKLEAGKASIEAGFELLQSENEALGEENKEKDARISSLKQQLTDTTAMYESLLQEQHVTILNNEEEISSLKESIEERAKELQASYAELQNKMIEIDNLQDECGNREMLIREKDNEIASMSDEIANLESVIKSKEEEMGALRKRIDELNEKMEQSKPLKDYDELLGQLRDKDTILDKLHCEINTVTKENSNLSEKVKDLSEQNGNIRRELVNKEKELADYAATNERLEAQIVETKKETDEAEKRIVELHSIIYNSGKYVDDLQEELRGSYKMIEQLKLKHTEDVELQNQRLERLIEDLNSKTEECETLKSELQEKERLTAHCVTEEVKLALEAKMADTEQKLKVSEDKIQMQLEKMKKLAANLKRKTAVCQELESRVTELEEKWTTEKDEKEAKNKQIQDVEIAIREKDNIIAELQEKLTRARNENEEVLEDLANTREKMALLAQQTQEMEQMIGKLRADLEFQIAEVTNEREAKQNVTSEYELYKKQIVEENEHKQIELEDVKERARELSVRMQVMEAEYVEQLALIKNLKAENGLLLSKQTQINEKLENVEKESEERRLLIERMQKATVDSVTESTQTTDEESTVEDGKVGGARRCSHCEQCQTLVQALEAKLQEREAEIENLDNELANSIGNFVRMNQIGMRNRSLDDPYNDLLFQYNSLVSSHEEVKGRLDEALKVNKELIGKIEHLQSMNATLEETTTTVTEQNLIESEQERLSPTDSSDFNLAKKCEQREAESLKLQGDLQAIRDHANELEQQLHAQTILLKSMEDTKKNLEQEIASLKSDKDMHDKVIEDLKVQLEEYKNQSGKAVDKSIVKRQANPFESAQDQEDQTPRLFDASKIFGTPQASVSDGLTDNESKRLQALLDEREAHCSNLTQEINHLQRLMVEERSQLSQKYSQCLQELEFAQAQFKAATKNLEGLEQTLTEKDRQIDRLSTELRNISQSMEQQNDRVDELKKSLLTKDSQLEELRMNLNSTGGTLNEMIAEQEQRNALLETYKLQINNLEVELKNSTDSDLIQDLEKRLSNTTKERELLQLQVNDLSRSLETFKDSMRAEVENAVRERNEAKELVANLTQALADVSKQSDVVSIRDPLIQKTTAMEEVARIQKEKPESAAVKDTCEDLKQTASVEIVSGALSEPPADDGTAWEMEKLNVDEETWGWDADGAQLAGGEQLTAAVVPSTEMQLRAKVGDLEDQIKDLKQERDKMLEENKAVQLKCAKLIKKLKEYKVQVENLQHQLKTQRSTSDFYELDSAIEQELKCQIGKLEKALSEVREEQKNTVAEKEALTRRLDVVVSANERYMEMKERQDMDMEVLRIRNKELSEKVEALDKRLQGGSSEPEASDVPTNESIVSKEESTPVAHERVRKRSVETVDYESLCKRYKGEIDDLKDEMEALAAENEQLQHFLEEQKMKLFSVEKMRVADENESIQIVDDLNKRIAELQAMLSKSREEYDVLRKQYEQSLMDANEQVTVVRQNADLLKEEARHKIGKLETEIADLRQQLEVSESKVIELQQSLQDVSQEKTGLEESLTAELASSEKQLSALNASMAEVTDLLNIRIQEVADLKQELQRQYVDHEDAKMKLQETVQGLNQTLGEKKQELESLREALRVKDDQFVQQQSVEVVSTLVSQATQDLVQKHVLELEDKEREIHNLGGKLSMLEAAMSELSLEKQSIVARFDAQQQQLQLSKQNLESSQASLATAEEKLTEKERELFDSKERIETLVVENENHLETIGQLQQRLYEFEAIASDTNELMSRIQRLEASLLEKESILARRDQESNEYRNILENNRIEISELRAEVQQIDKLKDELAEKTEQISHLSAELDATCKVLEETRQMLNEKTRLLERCNCTLNEQKPESDQPSTVESNQPSSSLADSFPLFRMSDDNHDLQETIDTMQAELQKKQEEIEHLKYVLNENTYPSIIQEMQDTLNCLYNEKAELKLSLDMASKKIHEKEKEIEALNQYLQTQNEEVPSVTQTNLLSKERTSMEDQEKIIKLQNELHIKEQEINELKYIIAEKDSQLSLQASMEPQSDDFELRDTVQRLTGELYGKEQEIHRLKATIAELEAEVLRLQEFERLSVETKDAIQRLSMEKEQVRLQAEEFLERVLKEKEMEIEEIKQRLSVENQRIMDQLQLGNKDIENLKKQLEESSMMERTIQDKLHQKEDELIRVSNDLEEKERRLAELSITKDAELYNLKVQIHEKETRIEQLLLSFDEEQRQLNEAKSVLTARETEINSLKDLLEDKVRELELIQSVLKKDVSVVEGSTGQREEASGEENRASSSQELDLALYMLHQRDVRCEELTHELMQLLEERDTLQLRLSNAIRVNEELRRMVGTDASSRNEASSFVSEEPMVEHPSPSKSKGPVEIAKEAIDTPIGEDREALALKLSQLQTVSHAKDVRLKDERGLRHAQQMSLLAHKDVLSTLPPEAAARLVNANYTLSRDVQSQSSVLLNWLWGKSTPKVVHM